MHVARSKKVFPIVSAVLIAALALLSILPNATAARADSEIVYSKINSYDLTPDFDYVSDSNSMMIKKIYGQSVAVYQVQGPCGVYLDPGSVHYEFTGTYGNLITYTAGHSYQIPPNRSVIDLTLMYGSGREPRSGSQFESTMNWRKLSENTVRNYSAFEETVLNDAVKIYVGDVGSDTLISTLLTALPTVTLRSAGSVCDEVEFVAGYGGYNAVLTQRVAQIRGSDLEWTDTIYDESADMIYSSAELPTDAAAQDASVSANFLTSKYAVYPASSLVNNTLGVDGRTVISSGGSDCNDEDLIINYELAEPVTTVIMANVPSTAIAATLHSDYKVINTSSNIAARGFEILLPRSSETFRVSFSDYRRPAIADQFVRDGDVANEPSPFSVYGYTFLGWYLNNEPYDFSTPVTSDLTLVAKYEMTFYTVTFSESGYDDVHASYGSKLTEPEPPTREGYVFTGWFKDPELTKKYDFSKETVTSELTLYAGFKTAASTSAENPTEEAIDQIATGFGLFNFDSTASVIIIVGGVIVILAIILSR